MIGENFRQAIQNIWSNKFRTILTMLGIIIGVMAVIVIVGLGNGMTQSMKDQFSSLGTNTLSVTVMGYGARSVDVQDMYDIVDAHPELFSAMSPSVSISGTVKVDTTSYSQTSASGVSEDYISMSSYTVAQGRGLTYVDIADNKKVCVVGAYINRVAYGGNALGQTIKIGANKYTIVGVLDAKVTDLSAQKGSKDDCVLIPYTTAMRLGGNATAGSYTVVLADETQSSAGTKVIEDGLYSILHSSDGYFVMSMSEMLASLTSIINMVVAVLAGIAALSLLVGGIGIMNIMMVSVTERTREIGIRKALGAKERYILGLFVTEAATTSALGGCIGIALGFGISTIANKILAIVLTTISLSITPDFSSAMTAFSISVGIGILFGYLPARRAARLNPIDALRYD